MILQADDTNSSTSPASAKSPWIMEWKKLWIELKSWRNYWQSSEKGDFLKDMGTSTIFLISSVYDVSSDALVAESYIGMYILIFCKEFGYLKTLFGTRGILLGSLHRLHLHFLAFDHVRTPPSLHFLCSKFSIFLTTYPPLDANVICGGSLIQIKSK